MNSVGFSVCNSTAIPDPFRSAPNESQVKNLTLNSNFLSSSSLHFQISEELFDSPW